MGLTKVEVDRRRGRRSHAHDIFAQSGDAALTEQLARSVNVPVGDSRQSSCDTSSFSQNG